MKTHILILIIICSLSVRAMVIPSSCRVEWNKAGFHMPTSQPQFFANVIDFGAAADGITDDKQSIVNAIASLNGNYGIVYFPAGTYLLESGIDLPDSVILRGSGSNTTFIKINSSENFFRINGSASNLFTDILSGYQKDSYKITVKNDDLFQSGDYVEIRQDNGNWNNGTYTKMIKAVGQITKIKSKNGDTLILEDKLRLNFDPSLNLEIRKIIPKREVCIEYLNIERINTSKDATGFNICFNLAVNCSVKGIESNKSQGSHCKISLSSNIEVTGCFFHDANMYDGVGTKGYGVTIDSHSGLCLVSNNIFKHLRHAMMTKDGANGNVFAYNYSTDVFRNGKGEYPDDFAGDISLHGHFSYANLFEGNIVQNIIIDNTKGPSGPYNTFFRNRIQHYGLFMVSEFTNSSNYVGNEIIGDFLNGLCMILGSNNYLYGNNLNGSVTPSGITTLKDSSYYLTNLPVFWNIKGSWPSIGINNILNSGTIPAKERFLKGIYTDNSDDNFMKVPFNGNGISADIYPNPANDKIVVELNSKMSTNAIISFVDLLGHTFRKYYFDLIQKGDNQKTFNISDIPNGIYIVKITSEIGSSEKKIVVN